MLDKTYEPAQVEDRHYKRWENEGCFKHGQNENSDPYTIVIPPPNVTGSLHMGHALNNTLQDVLIRHKRMQGLDVLWQPGMDHAGIATQMVVERKLDAEGIKRRDLGREKFLEKVWEWKGESGGSITNQLRRLGASCDWSRERFTMDDGLSRAVLKVFVELYKQGLIYRDKRLVNWDPKLETAISDLEVEQKETNGHMWYFQYPVEGSNESLTVATTRPETMLGDTGIAVHPDDERYQHLIGKDCVHPLTGLKLRIVGDDYADPEQGTGAVKMTPAHDFNDFEVGRRHDLEMINVFTTKATINDNAPEKYRGMDRFEARDAVIADMDALGLYEKVEDHVHMVPFGDRGGVPIEPFLTDQWYVDAKTLAKPAIEAVEDGRVKFVPEQWTKTYYEWMYNIQPWCVSRQLWWGHQIPAWYGPDGEVFVETSEEEAQKAAEAHYGKAVELKRDDDVLDTWFSSALWPFSTLGWPDETPELVDRHYPTDVLVTGFDIIFFWVARMMMMGMHFMEEEPFHTVYVHALVRDEKGAKMSKSKGNVIDPLKLIDQYGADALRFTLISMAAPGRDIKLATSRVEGYRNFTTKLWNAARFCEMNECVLGQDFDPKTAKETVNRWIVSEVVKTTRAIDEALAVYRFNDAASAIYQFVWGTFCDWYVELIKPLLNSDDAAVVAETRACAGWVLQQILHLMHPFTPFITEELWEKLGKGTDQPLITDAWPSFEDDMIDASALEEMNWVLGLISGVRSVRSEMNVPPAAKIPMLLQGGSDQDKAWLESNWAVIGRLARLESYAFDGELPKGSIELLHNGARVGLPLAEVIDLNQELARLEKAIKKADGEITKIEKKLSNEGFLAKAPEEVVEENKERLATEKDARAKLQDSLDRIKAAL
ncbi:valine--tRNA ligase [Aestuariispira ectoiniformans]|uniref:valine--tRNA ligase n=1 Tax=Aestuariispira ectoiniformans TaxID=2775080 RepID=UPI00223AE66E|nr:valine--tRNA ligase [Aestuariispira ectoiniformans]